MSFSSTTRRIGSAKRESAVAATDWLQQEIERLRARVAEAEQAVADYSQQHGLFDVDQSSTGTEIGRASCRERVL